MALTKAQLEEFRKDIKEQLQIVEMKHGCKIKMGNISYGDFNFTSKIEVEVANDDGIIDTKEARDYKTHCFLFDLNPEWLNQNVSHQGKSGTSLDSILVPENSRSLLKDKEQMALFISSRQKQFLVHLK